MMNTVNRIEAFNNARVVRFFKYFSQKIFSGLDSSLEDVLAGVPDSIRNTDSFAQIEQLASEDIQDNLNLEQSALIARKVLLSLATDETFEQILDTALDRFDDSELGAGNIIAVGAAVSMILVTATTAVEGEVFGIRFKKKTADTELVKLVTKTAAEIFLRACPNKL